jgi:HEAT repeat protein
VSAARTVLTLAAVAVVLPLAMRARDTGTARVNMASAGTVEVEGAQATPAEVRAYLEAIRGANPVQCEIVISGFNSWSWNHAPDRDTTAWKLTMVTHRSIKSADVVPDLVAAMKSADPCVARVAARMLGQTELAPARRELLAALTDENAQVRQLAAIGLGFSEDSTLTAPLVKALADRDARVRAAAAWALGAVN